MRVCCKIANRSLRRSSLVGSRRALLLCFSAVFAMNMSVVAYAPILAILKSELRLSYTEAGMVASAYFISYAVGQIPWGLLADRYGGKRIVIAGLLGAGASTGLFAFSASELIAVALRFICGLLAAGIFVPSIRIVSDWFAQNKRGVALGTLGVGSSLATLIVGFAMPLLTAYLGWRLATQVFAAVSIADAGILWVLLRESPSRRLEKTKLDERSLAPQPIRDRGFLILGYIQFVRYGFHNALVTWIPLFLAEAFGMSLLLAGAAISWIFMITMISDPLGGLISDKVGRAPVMSTSLFVLAVLASGIAFNRNPILIWILLTGVGWFVEFYRGPLFAAVPDRYGIERTGSVSAAHNTFAAVGAFAVPLLFGWLRDLSGTFWFGWLAIVGLLLSAAVSVFVLPKTAARTV
jgi:MFS family permease